MSTARPFDAAARAQTATWLENWKRVGPVLEAQRVSELRQLTAEESARIAVEFLWPMVPPGPGDGGEGLRPMREVLRRLAERA